MKLSTFLIPLLCLQCALLVSCQTLSDLIYQLVEENGAATLAAKQKLSSETDSAKSELNNLLNRHTIPFLNELYADIENYVEKLKEDTTAGGYDPTACITEVKEHLETNSITPVIDRAIVEMKTIFEKIASNIHLTSSANVQVISNEVNTITSDFSICMSSVSPEYCNRTLSTKIIHKLDELPILYNEEVERTAVSLTELVVTYESRIQDYLQEAVTLAKPYLSLLESCISVVLTSS